ncbi:hypothetical protein [Streptomyces sp. NPDC057910]|uniref:hypothetical protein n=1 Tax=Streptomyces sp. NPDC057910 TaxID=3346278 RepID=UPI001DD19E88|nr:hypothetical protein [Streptomyces sp. MAG02]
MLQRNPHPYALDVPDIPATVQPGETVDWDRPIAGFEPVDDSSPAEAEDPKPTRSKKAAPSAPVDEEPKP